MIDDFENTADSPIAPAQACFAITPSDTLDLPMATKGIYVGVGGDLNVLSLRGDQPVLFRNVPDGAIIDIRAQQILASGTTADAIVGLA
ncbi:spike base protein, RCAP_Rcc01079 family [Aurantiacibacter sediminis]|uniref:Uncharacterized protein n=1 Tax=Aurantiacibacter sediminis TaxID=2793064 RepID=A0ABS0N1X2_9SPHN|nr:hypothetical protein [Aurantiacibacter sediminis]MBH5321251.1 hypothetical protein [Aurantiacibacter sediminis]